MQNACGVRELKTLIRILPLKQFQLKFLLQKKVEKLNFVLVVMNMKLLNLQKLNQALKNLDYVLKIHPFIGIKKLRPYIQNLLKQSSI